MRFVLLALAALTVGQSATPQSQADPRLVRVFIHTDDGGEANELAARRESVKHLSDALNGKKKLFAIVTEEDRADVIVDVRGRGLIVPKVVIGLGARPGDPPGGAAMARVVQLTVSVKAQQLSDNESFKNKNSPVESRLGWKSAADDVAKQIEKWVGDRRTAILAAR